jgi:phosphoribosylformylglycinamidine cyclo-ligase
MGEKPRTGAEPLTYREAGVDIDRQDEALRRIKGMVASARTPGVLSELGNFGGLFAPDWSRMERPVLVSSCDGIGTKLSVAFLTGVHDTVGRDLVNHCVNDILVQGATPLFFLDYVATGRLDPAVLADVVSGVARGCKEAGCALLGGETAEMPGFYSDGEYDVAGFIVGAVDREKLIDGKQVRPGDLLIGLPSAGLHTNGYSLARKILFERAGLAATDHVEAFETTVGQALLAEHRSYLACLTLPLERGWIKGLAHITGGGIVDNVPRTLPEGTGARVERGSWPVPPLFTYLQRVGNVPEADMDRTFNMGLGMVAICDEGQARELAAHLKGLSEAHYRIGVVTSGASQVLYV